MNTKFEEFSHELVEKYMKRCLAYGMFPGFFSHNASQGHYFSRPELYERDRKLFKKYVPLCRLVAEAGWEPVTKAWSDNHQIHIERFGAQYLTIFNNGADQQVVTVRLEKDLSILKPGRELVNNKKIDWNQGQATFTLPGEDVLVIQLFSSDSDQDF